MGCCGSKKPSMAELGKRYILTEQQLGTFKQAFDQFDKNKDGKIVASELCEVMQSLGFKTVTTQMSVDMIAVVDKDKSGAIEFDEFVSLMATHQVNEQENNTALLFSIFDKNKDGFITGDDIKQTMKSMDISLTDKQVDDMMLEADKDKDGKINEKEFKSVYSKLMKRTC